MRIIEPFDLWLFICLGPSLWKGGGPERIAAAMIVVTSMATKVSIEGLHLTYRAANPIVIAIDVILAIGLYVVALKANRIWPMLLAAVQICAVLAHVAKLTIADLDPLAYYVIVTKWSYLLAVIPLVGAIRHQSRLSAFTTDKSWS